MLSNETPVVADFGINKFKIFAIFCRLSSSPEETAEDMCVCNKCAKAVSIETLLRNGDVGRDDKRREMIADAGLENEGPTSHMKREEV